VLFRIFCFVDFGFWFLNKRLGKIIQQENEGLQEEVQILKNKENNRVNPLKGVFKVLSRGYALFWLLGIIL
tara:strand:- start:247 stop:459 length:213 start_codon:yes stop_codon:yes gene_type:complete